MGFNGTMPHRMSRLIGCLGFLVALGACKVPGGKVEENIKDYFKDEGVELTSIKCPSDIKLKEGTTFECTGESDLGDEFTIEGKVTDGQGSFKWELVGKVGKYAEIEKNLEKTGASSAKCGKGKFIAVKGTKVKCKVDGEELTVKFTDNEGNVDLVPGKRPPPPT
jgi:hypothetical protein